MKLTELNFPKKIKTYSKQKMIKINICMIKKNY